MMILKISRNGEVHIQISGERESCIMTLPKNIDQEMPGCATGASAATVRIRKGDTGDEYI
jgi:hypothetical protein